MPGRRWEIIMKKIPRSINKQKLLKDHAALLIGGSATTPKGSPEFPYIEEIHHRAETVTPLLKQILEFRPTPSWHA